MEFIFIYLTASDSTEAEKIVSSLLKNKLIACANVYPAMKSMYFWQDEVRSEQEVGVFLKTRKNLFESVRENILAQHSYECPCIVALPILQGHGPFLDWISASTDS